MFCLHNEIIRFASIEHYKAEEMKIELKVRGEGVRLSDI
jgi:hypothetical protein